MKFYLTWLQLFVRFTFIAALSNAMIVRIVDLMVNIGFKRHISTFIPTDGVHEFKQSSAGSITAPPQISTVRTIVAIWGQSKRVVLIHTRPNWAYPIRKMTKNSNTSDVCANILKWAIAAQNIAIKRLLNVNENHQESQYGSNFIPICCIKCLLRYDLSSTIR